MGSLWMEVISESYWPDGRINNGLVFRAIPYNFRSGAREMQEQVHVWTSDALSPFVRSASRVLRHSIETMQRFIATGLPMCCAAVRTEESILRSWRSYLGQ